MTEPELRIARRLQALARTGLSFCVSEYDRERYEQVEQLALELLGGESVADHERLRALWSREQG